MWLIDFLFGLSKERLSKMTDPADGLEAVRLWQTLQVLYGSPIDGPQKHFLTLLDPRHLTFKNRIYNQRMMRIHSLFPFLILHDYTFKHISGIQQPL